VEEFNPYQPPAHSDFVPPPAVGQPGEPLPWSIETALSVGWDRVKHWWPVLIFGPALVMVGQYAISFAAAQLGLVGVDSVISLILGAFFGVGILRMFLSAVRPEEPRFEQIVGGADRMWALLATQMLYAVVVVLGTILLIVPGIILGLGLCLAPYLCVEQQLGPVESLKKSWALMDGCKAQMLGFGVVAIFLVIAGALALFVGMFVANAVIYAGFAWIYLRRRGEVVPERAADRLGQFR
jgi:hypothetical protein